MTGIDGGDSWAYYEAINAANNEESYYVRITGSVFIQTWSAQRNIGFSVRLATVVSELAGVVVVLFLPAAGYGLAGGFDYVGVNFYYVSSCTHSDSSFRDMYGSRSGFSTTHGSYGGRSVRDGVRLATVVSGSAWRGLLFLPAAGLRRPSGVVSNVGDEFTCWTNQTTGLLNALRVSISSSAFNVKQGIDRGYGWSIRLATVVSGLTWDVESVPACCGEPSWRGGGKCRLIWALSYD